MKIKEAIEILQLSNKPKNYWPGSNLQTAIKLGIEALKEIQQIRNEGKPHYLQKLPGETKED